MQATCVTLKGKKRLNSFNPIYPKYHNINKILMRTLDSFIGNL